MAAVQAVRALDRGWLETVRLRLVLAGLAAAEAADGRIVGRYVFNIEASGPGQGLRPLRDPDAPELDEEDDGILN
ncbi:hypothetical protein [Streptomyces griseoaurantiacus]|uniref:hypothetical protein n=1 Tax=Streptomyces griseoaurantiacus TaxID=68213 RepID=UPI0037A5BED2